MLVVARPRLYCLPMCYLEEIRWGKIAAKLVLVCVFLLSAYSSQAFAQSDEVPDKSAAVVHALNQSQWQQLEDGLEVIRAVTEDGTVFTSFKISPEIFSFSIVLQDDQRGARARQIGEREGAVLAANAGFFAITDSESLYPIGYLRLSGKVLSKGWPRTGGVVSLRQDSLVLTPSHAGIPKGEYDVIQTKPMLIEPGGNWAMGSNSGEAKPRTLLCTLVNGDVVLSVVTRLGMSLYEAGWVMREPEYGGFFECDAAVAFDGGRSTQVWYSRDDKYSSAGILPVQNFFVVRQREE